MSPAVETRDSSSSGMALRPQTTPHLRPRSDPELSSSLLAELEMDFELPEAAVGLNGTPLLRFSAPPSISMDLDMDSFMLPPAFGEESLEKDPEALIDSSDNVTFTFDVAGDESESEFDDSNTDYTSSSEIFHVLEQHHFEVDEDLVCSEIGPYMDQFNYKKRDRQVSSSTCSTRSSKSSSPVRDISSALQGMALAALHV
mmetsp:Transcript_57762/g.135061  ORF Transcript_57762/g.135061 Transcript_57762/m.135061 type:complete len:200 (+) Transcript_57762:164-763(+)